MRKNRVQQKLPRFSESHLHSTKVISTTLFCAICYSSFLQWAFDTRSIKLATEEDKKRVAARYYDNPFHYGSEADYSVHNIVLRLHNQIVI